MSDLYKDKNGRLWVSVELDDGEIILEDTFDVSKDYEFPTNCIYESGDSEFLDYEFAKDMTKILSDLCLVHYQSRIYHYINKEKIIKFLEQKYAKANLKKITKLNAKYNSILQCLFKE